MTVLIGGISGTKSKIKSIEIWGKKWFQKSYGNTYHKVKVYVNGDLIGTSPITYGYGDSYIQTAEDILKKNGYLKRKDPMLSLWKYTRDRGIKYQAYSNDVKTERELKNF